MISTITAVIWLVAAALAIGIGFFVVRAKSRKSRELFTLYREVIATRSALGRGLGNAEENPVGHGLHAAELKRLIVGLRIRETPTPAVSVE